MWISDPMPVTTRIITDDSGSSRSVKAAVKSPDVIQVNASLAIARDSSGNPTSCHAETSETRNEPTIAPQATAPAAALLTRLPKLAFSRKPTNGSSGISSSIDTRTKKKPRSTLRSPRTYSLCGLCGLGGKTTASPFQAREGVGVQRFPVPEQADHDRQA